MPPISTLDGLKKDYMDKAVRAKNYRRANFIFDLESADAFYLELLIERDEAYAEYKKVELGESEYNRVENIRVSHRLDHYRQLLCLAKNGVIV